MSENIFPSPLFGIRASRVTVTNVPACIHVHASTQRLSSMGEMKPASRLARGAPGVSYTALRSIDLCYCDNKDGAMLFGIRVIVAESVVVPINLTRTQGLATLV